jgi:hypothetical protein
MLAIESKVCVFKPGRWQWILKGDKNPQYVFFGIEVKPSAP